MIRSRVIYKKDLVLFCLLSYNRGSWGLVNLVTDPNEELKSLSHLHTPNSNQTLMKKWTFITKNFNHGNSRISNNFRIFFGKGLTDAFRAVDEPSVRACASEVVISAVETKHFATSLVVEAHVVRPGVPFGVGDVMT